MKKQILTLCLCRPDIVYLLADIVDAVGDKVDVILDGGAGGQAKAAMHTRADCVGHGWRLCAKLFTGNVVLHFGLPLAR